LDNKADRNEKKLYISVVWFYFHVAVATDRRMYTTPDIA